MKKTIAFAGLISLALILVPFIHAQGRSSVSGQSLNGATGLFTIPTGHIGWEEAGNFAMDFGYRAIINNNHGTSHIPALTASLFKWVELSAALDIQPDFKNYNRNYENNDLLLGLKIRLPTRNTAIAIGGNLQIINIENDVYSRNAYQPYIAVTYPGAFFAMQAETTVVFGKTFYSDRNNDTSIDFGMGFDLILLPSVFGNTVHWIIDFSNFNYSDNAWPHYSFNNSSETLWRGVLNTGFRFDLSTIPALSKFKFLIDIIFNDLFDDGQRSFTIGAVFGFQAS